MVKQSQLAAPERMKRVRARIRMWRLQREKMGPMPAPLWREAAALAHELGAGPVGRTLGLNHQMLTRKMDLEASGSGEAAVPTARFVELGRAQVLSSAVATGPVVELSDAMGVRLTVRFAAGSALNLTELVAVFRGRRE